MTSYTDLFSAAQSISRLWYSSVTPNSATTASVLSPVGARCCIISMVAAGGWKTNSPYPGGGSSFARKKLIDLVDGEELDIQVGSAVFSLDAGTTAADSWVKRVSAANAIICKAVHGTGVTVNSGGIVNGGTPGLAVNSVGDIVRDGQYGNTSGGNYIGGASGGDSGDTYCLGFGGRGVHHGRYPAAGWGGGGIHRLTYDAQGHSKAYYPGAGKVCIEFFTKDPGYF